MPTYRTAAVDATHNDEELRLNLDLLEERRERAAIREAKAKLKMTKYYNARVRGVTFRQRDFVYRSNDASHAVGGGKLSPKWEGPYKTLGAKDSRNTIGSSMIGRTNTVSAAHNPALLLLLSRLMFATIASPDNISSLKAQGSSGSRTAGYTGMVSWEDLGHKSRIHYGASSLVSLSKCKDAMIKSSGASFNFSS
ncbi:hypothetical protein Tco_1492920 [Tanacetum coccineum]